MAFKKIIDGVSIYKGGSLLTPSLKTKNNSYTLTIEDRGTSIICNGTLTITIPSGVFSAGDRVEFVNTGTGIVTFIGNGLTLGSVDQAISIDTQWAGAALLFTSPTSAILVGKLA